MGKGSPMSHRLVSNAWAQVILLIHSPKCGNYRHDHSAWLLLFTLWQADYVNDEFHFWSVDRCFNTKPENTEADLVRLAVIGLGHQLSLPRPQPWFQMNLKYHEQHNNDLDPTGQGWVIHSLAQSSNNCP